MNNTILILLAALAWGVSTFIQRLSAERMSPFLMQVISACAFIFFIPIGLNMANSAGGIKWSAYSIVLTAIATFISIGGNILLYSGLKGNSNSGSSAMLISLYPVITMMLTVFFLNESMSATKIAGVITMIIGAILLSLR